MLNKLLWKDGDGLLFSEKKHCICTQSYSASQENWTKNKRKLIFWLKFPSLRQLIEYSLFQYERTI